MTHAATTTVAMSLMPKWLTVDYLQHALGGWLLPVVAVIIFAECGLLIGFFLPGDTLLFPLGLLIATNVVQTPLWLACVILSACAVLGNIVGYGVGWKLGDTLFDKPDSRLFRREYVDKTHAFFEKYGARAILLARLVPIVRTFITAVAGVGRMDPRKYFTYSIIGGVIWATAVTMLGYFLGRISFVSSHIELIVVLIGVISVLPMVFEYLKARRERKAAAPH